MSQIGTVIPSDGLRVRNGAGTEHEILGLLLQGDQVTLIERVGDWWRVDSRVGPGFVHADFVALVPDGDGVSEPPPAEASPATYTCVPGDTLSGIGQKIGLDFRAIAALNGLVAPFAIQVGQVLRLPAVAVRPSVTTIEILNPLEFEGETDVTSSSRQGHHRPYLGSCSCDVDIRGASSPGTTVRFNVAGPDGLELRGVVREVGLACKSQMLSDGGRTVKVEIQRRQAGGTWTPSGAWVLYAHLDPVDVAVGDVLAPAAEIGRLGPPSGGEYDSSCAQGSHTHIEAAGAICVVDEGSSIRNAAVMVRES